MSDSCDTRYLVKLTLIFNGDLEKDHKAVAERLNKSHNINAVKVNRLSHNQVEITDAVRENIVNDSLFERRSVHENLKVIKEGLEQYNKIMKESTGQDALEISCLYKEAYDTCDGCD